MATVARAPSRTLPISASGIATRTFTGFRSRTAIPGVPAATVSPTSIRRRPQPRTGGVFRLPAGSLTRHVVFLVRGRVRGFNLLEVVGRQALVVKQKLHPCVLVLPALEVDARLFQLLWPQPCLSLFRGSPRRS